MATRDLHEKVGSFSPDGLIAGLEPVALVRAGIIRKLSAAATLVRGTLLAKSSKDNKLVVLGTTAGSGETLTADCVLTDDIEIGTAEDENVTVYISGNFDAEKVTVADSYTITEADKDALRVRNILLTKVQKP